MGGELPDGERKSFDGIDGSEQLGVGETPRTHQTGLLCLIRVENYQLHVVLVFTRAALLRARRFLEPRQDFPLQLFAHLQDFIIKSSELYITEFIIMITN